MLLFSTSWTKLLGAGGPVSNAIGSSAGRLSSSCSQLRAQCSVTRTIGALLAEVPGNGFAAGKFLQQGRSAQPFFFSGVPCFAVFAECIGHSSATLSSSATTAVEMAVVAAASAQ